MAYDGTRWNGTYAGREVRAAGNPTGRIYIRLEALLATTKRHLCNTARIYACIQTMAGNLRASMSRPTQTNQTVSGKLKWLLDGSHGNPASETLHAIGNENYE